MLGIQRNSVRIRQLGYVSDRKSSLLATIRKYGTNLFGFIRGRVGSQEEAEDILQDVWYQLSRIMDLDEIENMSGWLYRVARNRITDRFRKKEPVLLSGYGDDDNLADLFELLTGEAETPEELFFREMFWSELEEALDELPQNQRDTFVWNELEDQTLQEIADRTGEKLKTVISRKGYAVKHLRNRLQALYDELNES